MVLTFMSWHDAVHNFLWFNKTRYASTQRDVLGVANAKHVQGCTSVGQNASLLIDVEPAVECADRNRATGHISYIWPLT